MATVEVTEKNLKNLVSDNPIVVLDFWATWCGPCRQFGPIFEKVSTTHPDVVFGKVDIDKEIAIAQTFSVQAVPTVAVIVGGELIHSQPGGLTAPALEKIIETAGQM